MTKNAHQSLPGAAFFFTQRATEIGQDEQLVRQALLPKRAPSNSPTTGSSWETERQRLVLISIVTGVEPEFRCRFAKQFIHWLTKQRLARAIDQTQTAFWIDGEDRDIDYSLDLPQKLYRFI